MTLSRELELETLQHDLAVARQRYSSLVRAQFEKRWCGTQDAYSAALRAAMARVARLERERAVLLAEHEAA